MAYIISTDAGADLDMDYINSSGIKVISMKYFLKEKKSELETEYTFGNGEAGQTIEEFYDKIRSGAQAKTTLINAEQHKEHFIGILDKGEDILHVSLSSGLSSTAQCAASAAEELSKEYPDRKIIVVDFKGASMGQGLFVDYLVKLKKENKTLEEVSEWADKNIFTFCHYFTVDDLGHLRRGGRVSGVAAVIGSLIKIKPLLHVDNAGKLIPVGKSIGRKRALTGLVEKMKLLSDGGKQTVFISHGDCIDDARFVAEKITEAFGITDIKIGFIGPIIGAHSGPGTVALFFVGKMR